MNRIALVLTGLVVAGLCLGGCSREHEKRSRLFPPVDVIVPSRISTMASTRILFSECIVPDDLSVRLTGQDDGLETLIVTITGDLQDDGCITEATFTPAYSLRDGASYTLAISATAVDYSGTVEASATLEYRPGAYLMVHNADRLNDISSDLRSWFVEFGEADEEGVFEVWHIDADPPGEGGEPVCLGWSADPQSKGKGAIGFVAHTGVKLNEAGDRFSTVEGESLSIRVEPVACVEGGRYEEQNVPSGEIVNGLLTVTEDLEVPCGTPTGVTQVFYVGNRCPEGTVLPHE